MTGCLHHSWGAEACQGEGCGRYLRCCLTCHLCATCLLKREPSPPGLEPHPEEAAAKVPVDPGLGKMA